MEAVALRQTPSSSLLLPPVLAMEPLRPHLALVGPRAGDGAWEHETKTSGSTLDLVLLCLKPRDGFDASAVQLAPIDVLPKPQPRLLPFPASFLVWASSHVMAPLRGFESSPKTAVRDVFLSGRWQPQVSPSTF